MQLKKLDETKYVQWESSSERVVMSHDSPYKSSQHYNHVVILINTLMMVKLQGLP